MDKFISTSTVNEHNVERSLQRNVDSILCYGYPPIRWHFYGKGFRGQAMYYPDLDIRGSKLGSAGRKLLLTLPVAEEPPCTREGLDGWVTIGTPAQRKVMRRLCTLGLIWVCYFYEFRGCSKSLKRVALTPLGAKVLAVFGEDIKQGRRIRWQKWNEPSVASSPEKWEEFLDEFGISAEPFEKRYRSKNSSGLKSYGNSRKYLAARIVRDERIWNSGGGYYFSFDFDSKFPSREIYESAGDYPEAERVTAEEVN